MNPHVLYALADELEKIALDPDLRKKKHRELVAKYMGVGAVAGPTAGMLRNAIAGSSIFGGLNPARWLAGGATTGALMSGSIPILREFIAKRTGRKYERKQEKRDFKRFLKLYRRSQHG